MKVELFGAIACICATVVAVKHFDARKAEAIAAAEVGPSALMTAEAAPAPEKAEWDDRSIRITAGANHQYFVTAAVNRRPASFLVDTGASFVSLRDSDARAAGVYTAVADYSHPVRTANGETKAALVALDAIEIEGIRVENVQAFILPDDQLNVNLLGMSFLSRLESVEQRGGELVLKG
jgi:aspartyl protease family protein